MILQLQPDQVSDYWGRIKPAAIAAMELDPLDTRTSEYSNNLFIALLNGSHQAWLIMDDAKDVYAVGVTCILEDKLTGAVSLHIDAFYSYQTLTAALVEEATQYVSAYAKAMNCTQIRALTNNHRASRLLDLAGFAPNKTEYLLHFG